MLTINKTPIKSYDRFKCGKQAFWQTLPSTFDTLSLNFLEFFRVGSPRITEFSVCVHTTESHRALINPRTLLHAEIK